MVVQQVVQLWESQQIPLVDVEERAVAHLASEAVVEVHLACLMVLVEEQLLAHQQIRVEAVVADPSWVEVVVDLWLGEALEVREFVVSVEVPLAFAATVVGQFELALAQHHHSIQLRQYSTLDYEI